MRSSPEHASQQSPSAPVRQGSVLPREKASKAKPVALPGVAHGALSAGHIAHRDVLPATPGARQSRRRTRSLEEEIAIARAEGWQAGYEAGQEAARKDVDEHQAGLVRRAVEALSQAAGAVAAGRASALAVAERDAAELAFELTRELVGRELSAAKVPGIDAVQRALALAVPGTEVKVHLHPEDARAFEQLNVWPDLSLVAPDCMIEVRPDRDVERGGCVVEAGACRIDAQIGPAMERVRRVLLGSGAEAS